MSKSPFEMLGMDLDEVLEADDALRTKPAVRDGRICLCGHGARKHSVHNGAVLCRPSRMTCPCRNLMPVFDSDDTRPFMRRTNGAGREHAFSRGLAKLMESGKSGTWLIPLACFACKSESDSLIPVPLTAEGFEVPSGGEMKGYDALMCPDCVTRMRMSSADRLLRSVDSEAE